MVMRRRAMLGEEVESTDILPDDYQQVEYIGANGAGQFILTEVRPQNGYIKFVAEYYKATQVTSGVNSLFCSYTVPIGGTRTYEVGFNTAANTIYAFSASSAKIVSPLIYGNKCHLEAVYQPTSPTASLSITANGMTVSETKTGANNSNMNNDPVCIFSHKNVGATVADIYSCKIYDSPSNLAFNGIPCYRKSDGKIGMYDTVSETFFTNAGAGTFIKGADV